MSFMNREGVIGGIVNARWVVPGLLAAAFCARLLAGFVLSDGLASPPTDSDSYFRIATAFAETNSLRNAEGEITALREPTFPILAGLLFKIVGPRYGAMLFLNTVLGVAGLWIAFLIGRDLLEERTAKLALAIGAFYPHYAYHAAQPMRETAQLFFGPLALWALLALLRRPEPRVAIGAAAASVLAALTNTTFLPFGLVLAPCCILYFLRARLKTAAATAGIYAVAFACFYAPWPARNYAAFDRPILGSTAGAGGTFHNYLIVPQEIGGTPEETEILRRDPVVRAARYIEDPAERESYYWREGIKKVAAAPFAYARLLAWRFFVDIWRVVPRERSYGYSSRLIRWVGILSDGWIIPLGLIGVFLIRLRPPEMLPLYLLLFSVNGVYAIVLTSIRYRISAMPWIILLCSAVLVRAFDAARTAVDRRT